jgi:hypothetical protein
MALKRAQASQYGQMVKNTKDNGPTTPMMDMVSSRISPALAAKMNTKAISKLATATVKESSAGKTPPPLSESGTWTRPLKGPTQIR